MDSKASIHNLLECMVLDASAEPIGLPLSVLKEITNDFSNDQQIGQGGSATVYMGQLRNGMIAVKKLVGLDMDENKFHQEVNCLMRVRHKNIVRFLGYCADTQGEMWNYEGKVVMAERRLRLLCFEFMPKGSLDAYITDASQGLDWLTRYKLIKGICEGLCYLHQMCFIHFDLKPANILLDDNMVPKIADFGLSRWFYEGQRHTISSKLFLSLGYLAPEFFRGVITFKLDIYSLGVIILEILTGRKGYSPIENVLQSWSNILKTSQQAGTLLEQVRVCCEIGLECIDSDPSKRPTAMSVTERLHEMETRCASVESDLYTSPLITHGMTNSIQGTMEAAVSSSLGAMSSLFRKLSTLLDPKYPLRSSLKHAIKRLMEDLEEIRDAHMEQLKADSHNSKAKYWMEEVREVSYDIEDSIDFMMLSHNPANEKSRSIHAPGHRVSRLKIRGLPNMLKLSTRIMRVAELRTLLWEASERHERYQLDGCVSNPRSVFSGHSSQITLVHKVVADPIGIEGPKKELTMWLTNQAEQQLKVLCIFGPAGVGKTTLAKELYRDFGRKFDCLAFTRVSRNPDISRLLQELFYQILRPNKQKFYACSAQGDIENIRKHLEDKRYFIVIDDLWEAEAWDIIKNAFPKGSNCSRVIITGEVNNIAGYHTIDTFEMKPLGSQDSEKLFLDRAFSSDNQCPDPLKEVSCRMLKECGGLPLAIISAAGLFASLRDNSDICHQLLQSVLSSLENLSLENPLKQIVSICYNNLPQELKTCLLYLTMYPVGCTIWKDDLLKQWAAEGFVTTKGNVRVAENYFNELVKRGMIQPEKINYDNEVLSCTVHHIVLDLITHKSREENFTTAVDYSQTIAMLFMKARRLSLYYSCARYASKPEGIRVSQVRSLAFFGLPRCMPSVTEFKLLRVLILEVWGNKDDCTSINLSRICRLFLLRYLKISSHIYVELPSEIHGLKFLETLEIDARVSAIPNEKMLEIDARESAVPNDIVYLPGLLHLHIRDGTKLPDQIGLITSLQTLKCFDLGYNSEDNVQSLGELINLRDLHLTCSKEVSHEHLKKKLVALASSLGRLANLKSLTLAHGAVGMTMLVDHSSAIFSTPMFLQRLKLPPTCIFSRLPEWIGELHNLCVLKIVVRVLPKSDIDILTGLPGLTVLSLYVRQPDAEGVVFNSGALPVLKYFKYMCSDLCIAFQEEALPNLRRLKVCFNFHRDVIYSRMISGVEHLLNLKEIAVRIGVANGIEESDKKAVESAFESTIHKDSRFPICMDVRRVDWVEE